MGPSARGTRRATPRGEGQRFLGRVSGAQRVGQAIPNELLPEENPDLLFRIYAVLLLAKGTGVSPEDVHNAWVAWMMTLVKQHDALVPFARLSPATRAEDDPFVEAIRRVALRRGWT